MFYLYGHSMYVSHTAVCGNGTHAGHCWRSRDELISDVLLWPPTYGRAKAGRPARTYIQQLCEDTGCSSEDLLEAMNGREKWREWVRDIRASGTKSSGLHPVSSHNCCMYVRAGRPAFARPYVGVHRSTFLMNSSLLLQQCPACLVRLI